MTSIGLISRGESTHRSNRSPPVKNCKKFLGAESAVGVKSCVKLTELAYFRGGQFKRARAEMDLFDWPCHFI